MPCGTADNTTVQVTFAQLTMSLGFPDPTIPAFNESLDAHRRSPRCCSPCWLSHLDHVSAYAREPGLCQQDDAALDPFPIHNHQPLGWGQPVAGRAFGLVSLLWDYVFPPLNHDHRGDHARDNRLLHNAAGQLSGHRTAYEVN
jgi:hypothetical protein